MPRLCLLALALAACANLKLPETENEPYSTATPMGSGSGLPGVRFQAAFEAVTERDGERIHTPVRGRLVLEAGAELTWYFERAPGLYLYAFRRGTSGELETLYPNELPEESGYAFILPPGTRRDGATGIERFHLIASRARLGALEGQSGDDLRREVNALRKRYERSTSQPSRPVPVGGSVKSKGEMLVYQAEEVGCWTFTLDHR